MDLTYKTHLIYVALFLLFSPWCRADTTNTFTYSHDLAYLILPTANVEKFDNMSRQTVAKVDFRNKSITRILYANHVIDMGLNNDKSMLAIMDINGISIVSLRDNNILFHQAGNYKRFSWASNRNTLAAISAEKFIIEIDATEGVVKESPYAHSGLPEIIWSESHDSFIYARNMDEVYTIQKGAFVQQPSVTAVIKHNISPDGKVYIDFISDEVTPLTAMLYSNDEKSLLAEYALEGSPNIIWGEDTVRLSPTTVINIKTLERITTINNDFNPYDYRELSISDSRYVLLYNYKTKTYCVEDSHTGQIVKTYTPFWSDLVDEGNRPASFKKVDFIYAALNRNHNLLKDMIEAGIETNGYFGFEALRHVLMQPRSDLDMAAFLLTRGVDINWKRTDYSQSLYQDLRQSYPKAASFVLSNGGKSKFSR